MPISSLRSRMVNRATLWAAGRISQSRRLNDLADDIGVTIKEKLMPSYVLGGLREMAKAEITLAHAREMQADNILAFRLLRGEKVEEFNRLFGGLRQHRLNLRGADLYNRDLAFVILHDADLSNAVFLSANLTVAYLDRADCTNATFDDSYLTRTNFKSAKLSGASFKGTTAVEADFTGASLDGADFTKAKALWAKGIPLEIILKFGLIV